MLVPSTSRATHFDRIRGTGMCYSTASWFLFTYLFVMEILWLTLPYVPSFWWFFIAALLVLFLAFFVVNKSTKLWLLFGWMYEWMYDFFADILWEEELLWIKSFITNMFFVILLYNILWVTFDFVAPIFWYNELLWRFSLAEYLGFATGDYHFTIAMAIIGVLLMLAIQLVSAWGKKVLWKEINAHRFFVPFIKLFNFIYEYVPFWWKGIITIEKWSMHPLLYYPVRVVIKAFDIVISLFVGFLDIIWILAKVISLAFRLFWNMLSGTALFTVLILWLSAWTARLTWWLELPLIAPLILVAQGLLVASIQAFVFPLLVAIFIKVARMWNDEQTQSTAA